MFLCFKFCVVFSLCYLEVFRKDLYLFIYCLVFSTLSLIDVCRFMFFCLSVLSHILFLIDLLSNYYTYYLYRRSYGLLTDRNLAEHTLHVKLQEYYINWLFSFFKIYLLFISFLVYWPVRTEVAKTAKKGELNRVFVYLLFIVPCAAAGKYKKGRLAKEIEPTAPTIKTHTNTTLF